MWVLWVLLTTGQWMPMQSYPSQGMCDKAVRTLLGTHQAQAKQPPLCLPNGHKP